MITVNEVFDKVEKQLNGIAPQSAIYPTMLYNSVVEAGDLCRIAYKREGDNVRVIEVSDNAFDVIGIHKWQMEGKLLSSFVNQTPEKIKEFLALVDKKKFIIKKMLLGVRLTETRSMIISHGNGVYYELLWKTDIEI